MADSSINKQEAPFGAVINVEHSLQSAQKNTKLCRFVSRKSGCNKGDQCTCYHPPTTEKPSTRKKTGTGDTNTREKKKIPIECRFFNSPRECRNFLNSRECRFEHVTKPGNKTTVTIITSSTKTILIPRKLSATNKTKTKMLCRFPQPNLSCNNRDH